MGSTARNVVHHGNKALKGARNFVASAGSKIKNIPIVGGMAYEAGKKLASAPVIAGMSAKNILEKAEDIGKRAVDIVGRRR